MTRLICGFRFPRVQSKGEALESVKHCLNLFKENTDIEIRDEQMLETSASNSRRNRESKSSA